MIVATDAGARDIRVFQYRRRIVNSNCNCAMVTIMETRPQQEPVFIQGNR